MNNQAKRSGGVFWPLLCLALILVGGYFFYSKFLANPCDVPIRYAIGDIDSRFKLSPADVRGAVDDAASRWNKQIGHNIYVYDPLAKLKVNLVYDSRQQQLDATKSKIAQFDAQSTSIEEFRLKLESLSKSYENDLVDYNQRVAYWNAHGGAPSDIYNQLTSERASLEKRRLAINDMAALLNTQISENNSNIADFNSQLQADKNKVITSGEYFTDGSKINIYTYDGLKELRLVLMHELGHAMSSQHDNDPESILYPVLQNQDLDNPLPTSEDLALTENICGLDGKTPSLETTILRLRQKAARLSTTQ